MRNFESPVAYYIQGNLNKMLQNVFTTLLIFLCSGALGYVFGQATPGGVKPSYVVGDVAAIGDKKITMSTKTGPVDIIITDKTTFKRATAENLSLATATAGAMTDISVGDKLTVSGFPAADGKSMPARTVYFVTKKDVAAKNAKESAEWSTRGIAGKVVAVNPQTGQIDVELRSLTGSTNLKLTPKSDAKYLRYAPNSERFNEAKESSFAEVKAGDMIRALGDKSADGLAFTAEKVLTGAFQTVAGTVKSIDVEKNEVVITNLQTKKDVTIMVTDTSLLKRYPADLAERMAGFQTGAGGARPIGQGGGARPAEKGQTTVVMPGGQGQTPSGPGRGGFGGARPGGGGGNIDEMLEKFPTIKPVDLKVGDMIAVSSTKNGSIERIRAIKLLAGVEPFLRMAQAANGRGRQGGVDQGFSIPGLDGIGFP